MMHFVTAFWEFWLGLFQFLPYGQDVHAAIGALGVGAGLTLVGAGWVLILVREASRRLHGARLFPRHHRLS